MRSDQQPSSDLPDKSVALPALLREQFTFAPRRLAEQAIQAALRYGMEEKAKDRTDPRGYAREFWDEPFPGYSGQCPPKEEMSWLHAK